MNQNNLSKIDSLLFNGLLNLKELWLEENCLVSVNRDSFKGLTDLELVCLGNNPITLFFPTMVGALCDSNPKCAIKTQKCDFLPSEPPKMYSLSYNIPIEELLDQGYENVYDFYYSLKTTSTELINIRSKCNNNSILCAGGSAVGSDSLILVSCGYCLSVLNETVPLRPVLNNGAYWYFSYVSGSSSFGFSPIFNIYQRNCDDYDNYQDNSTICWHINLAVGGWRLGKIWNLDLSNTYKKLLYLLK